MVFLRFCRNPRSTLGVSWFSGGKGRGKEEVTMVQTHGLTHINLAVRNLGRALRFYEQVFGLREYGRGDGLVHTQASDRHDILTFAEDPARAGLSGGIT